MSTLAFVRDGSTRTIVDGDEKTIMCDTKYYPWCPDDDETWKLFAAAPCLLAACKLFTENCRVMYRNPGYESLWFDGPYRLAMAAIAKARGQ